ncbi:MAG TPA: NAD(P)/FAD-dependent oxidoreductase [Thermoflexales bacterium]|nr:NAD(P)/FAD-dependent oxidoreductase [Thermoflexales bacterium]HQX09064.1 NAD(P)/FAD-dependent oxidoreductase [Thermoflexales bacterium]HQY25782.1 NAD(P)/FAD-dependent oxidoreductase [Thermoflexales bacterium]HRA53394.1 NAD(P)/FAD-dependent oxidoreductase [Thermoflexales bacterium]
MQSSDPIIIIGAGMAGLAAAERLRASGFHPLVLEASDRIGGRVRSDRANGVVELGAEFIHGARAATWEVLKRANLKTRPYEVDDATPRRFSYGGALQPVDWALANQIEAYVARGEQYAGPDISLTEWFKQIAPAGDPAATLARDRIARIEAASPDDLSALAVARERQLNTAGWENFRLPGGYDAVAATLAEGTRIRLNAPVTEVSWASAGAVVTLASGETLPARAVILTASLGVMQRGLIRFDPALPQRKRDAIGRLRMGPASKLILWFRRAFWPAFSFLGADRQLPSWWRAAEATALVGFAGGPDAIRLGELGERAAIEIALAELTALFGPDARNEFLRGALMDWPSEPWILGGYSYTPVGAGSAREDLAEPLSTLFFAGEATSINGHVGTVHGAIESGWRVAAEVMSGMR